MTVAEALDWGLKELTATATPRLEVEWLVAHAAGLPAADLWRSRDKSVDAAALETLFRRRREGEPIAYILGEQGFYKHLFIVRPGVLIPRPETEHIVETALQLFSNPPQSICDMGCGSGCIGLSLLREWPRTRLLAIDAETVPIEVTRENAFRLGLLDRCELVQTPIEGFREVEGQIEVFDLVVANPPYIDIADERVEPNVRKYEPARALFADDGGCALIFSWSEQALRLLRPGGWWICEIGMGQGKAVAEHLNQLGFQEIATVQDFSGKDRVVRARKRGS